MTGDPTALDRTGIHKTSSFAVSRLFPILFLAASQCTPYFFFFRRWRLYNSSYSTKVLKRQQTRLIATRREQKKRTSVFDPFSFICYFLFFLLLFTLRRKSSTSFLPTGTVRVDRPTSNHSLKCVSLARAVYTLGPESRRVDWVEAGVKMVAKETDLTSRRTLCARSQQPT